MAAVVFNPTLHSCVVLVYVCLLCPYDMVCIVYITNGLKEAGDKCPLRLTVNYVKWSYGVSFSKVKLLHHER